MQHLNNLSRCRVWPGTQMFHLFAYFRKFRFMILTFVKIVL